MRLFRLSIPYPLEDLMRRVILLILAGLLLLEMALSLQWRICHDTPILHYVAFLVDTFGLQPYKDIFETSPAGIYLFHWGLGRLFGYGDQAIRYGDLSWLLLLLAVTWKLMRPFGTWVAWGSALIFGLVYLGHGPVMSLQRDYVGIFPVALGVLVGTSPGHFPRWLKALITGICFGISATIKPHLSIGLPFVWAYLAGLDMDGPQSFLKRLISKKSLCLLILSGLGLLLPVGTYVLALWQMGSLPAFWEIFTQYLPLYLKLTGNHQALPWPERAYYLIQTYLKLGGHGLWLMAGGIGVAFLLLRTSRGFPMQPFVLLIGLLTLAYSIYTALAGQFWDYHWMPFQYFAVLSTSLLLVKLHAAKTLYRLLPLALLVIALLLGLRTPPEFWKQIKGDRPSPPNGGRVDEIAEYLKTYMDPFDTVQPLDWVRGGVHAMLLAKAKIATPFVHDTPFYHHLSEPYIQSLRKRFMRELRASSPRFVIEVMDRPRPFGEDTSPDFPELRLFLDTHYEVAVEKNEYRIHHRIRDRHSDIQTPLRKPASPLKILESGPANLTPSQNAPSGPADPVRRDLHVPS